MVVDISLTKESKKYLDKLINNAEKLQLKVETVNEATIIDCGINVKGSIEAGLLFTKISLGGLARVQLDYPASLENPFPKIVVQTSMPVLATLGCQAASWNINKENYFAMACGPGRALAQKPSKVYKIVEYKDETDLAILCLESDKMPPSKVIDYLADKCGVEKKTLYLLMIKTNCLVQFIQMAARAIELGTFRLVQQLGYPKERILHAVGAGLIPPASDDVELANDRVNNGLIYGTSLYLIVHSEKDDNLEELVEKLPSNSSTSYGKTFGELFKAAGGDFGKMDLSVLAPSEVIVNDIRTGEVYQKGKIDLSKLL